MANHTPSGHLGHIGMAFMVKRNGQIIGLQLVEDYDVGALHALNRRGLEPHTAR
jgi:hypothetical protein